MRTPSTTLLAGAESAPRRLSCAQGADGPLTTAITAFMRYAGQGWEIPVPIAGLGASRSRTRNTAECVPAANTPASSGARSTRWAIWRSRSSPGQSRCRTNARRRRASTLDETRSAGLFVEAPPRYLIPPTGSPSSKAQSSNARRLRNGARDRRTRRHRRTRNGDRRHRPVRRGHPGRRLDPSRTQGRRGHERQIDDIRMQVMWNRLISVVEEQAMTLLRTAFSTSVREAGDLSAGDI